MDDTEWVQYPNLPKHVAMVVSARLATLREMQTVYGLRDLYNFIEIMQVDNLNRWLAEQHAQQSRQG